MGLVTGSSWLGPGDRYSAFENLHKKMMEKEKDYSTFTHLSLLEDSGLQSQVKSQEYFRNNSNLNSFEESLGEAKRREKKNGIG